MIVSRLHKEREKFYSKLCILKNTTCGIVPETKEKTKVFSERIFFNFSRDLWKYIPIIQTRTFLIYIDNARDSAMMRNIE